VREYHPGDEIRAIDLERDRAAGHAFGKKFTEERELNSDTGLSMLALREILAAKYNPSAS